MESAGHDGAHDEPESDGPKTLLHPLLERGGGDDWTHPLGDESSRIGAPEDPPPACPAPTKDYFEELVLDRKQLKQLPPTSFQHLDGLLDREIRRVEDVVFKPEPDESNRYAGDKGSELGDDGLPEPEGEVVSKQERISVPVDKYPEYNFAGRILGPRGMTVKQLEQKTGCRILVRGRGSLKSRVQDGGVGQTEELHVVIVAEDAANRAQLKLDRAKLELDRLLNPKNEGMDDLKKKQLMELAIINGTYRPPPHLAQQGASGGATGFAPHGSSGMVGTPVPVVHRVGSGYDGTGQHRYAPQYQQHLRSGGDGFASGMGRTTNQPTTKVSSSDGLQAKTLVGVPSNFMAGLQENPIQTQTVQAVSMPQQQQQQSQAAAAQQQQQMMMQQAALAGGGGVIMPTQGGTYYVPWMNATSVPLGMTPNGVAPAHSTAVYANGAQTAVTTGMLQHCQTAPVQTYTPMQQQSMNAAMTALQSQGVYQVQQSPSAMVGVDGQRGLLAGVPPGLPMMNQHHQAQHLAVPEGYPSTSTHGGSIVGDLSTFAPQEVQHAKSESDELVQQILSMGNLSVSAAGNPSTPV